MKTRIVFLILAAVWLMVAAVALAQDATEQPDGSVTYTVKAGDIPDLIAAQYDVDLTCMMETNNLTVNSMIYPGDTLTISPSCPAYLGSSNVPVTRVFVDAPGTYTVKPGDVPDLIAAQFDVDTLCLMQFNNLSPRGTVYPNHVLAIPKECPHYRGSSPVGTQRTITYPAGIYVVQPNDTLDGIAQRLNVSIISLKIANGLPDSYVAFPDDVLKVPPDAPPYGVWPAIFYSAATVGKPYVVQPGDVLDLIAKQYDVDTRCLIDRNKITVPIYPGYQLRIPPDCPSYSGPPLPETLRDFALMAATTPAPAASITPAVTATLVAPTATAAPPTAVPPTATPVPPQGTPTATG